MNKRIKKSVILLLVLLMSNIAYTKENPFLSLNVKQTIVNDDNDQRNNGEFDTDYEGIIFVEPMISYEILLGEDFIFEDDDIKRYMQGIENEQKD